MSARKFGRHGWLLVLIGLFAGLIALAGCGGGSGSGSGAAFNIGGQLTTTPTRAATRSALPAGVTVTGYLWPDLKTVVATATTDSNGRYTLTYPHSAISKAAVVVASQTSGNSTVRYSAIVANLIGINIVDANLDPATTLTSEVVLATAAAAPTVKSLSSSAVATIYYEFKTWSAIDTTDVSVAGANVPSTLGGGLAAKGPAATFVAGDTAIQNEITLIANGGDVNVANGRATVQMARSLIFALATNASGQATSISSAFNTQLNALESGSTGTSAFIERLRFVSDLLSADTSSAEPLHGLTPGAYTQTIDKNTGERILTRTGNSPDGKSWVVTCATGQASNGQVATFTPANAIPTFKADTSAGAISLTVVNSADAALSYTASLSATLTGSNVTTIALTGKMTDSGLTKPITFTGTLTGVPAAGATGSDSYTSVNYSGSITGQWGQASVTNLAAKWAPASQTDLIQDLQKVTMDSMVLSSSTTPAGVQSVTNLEIDFNPTEASASAKNVVTKVAFSSELKGSSDDLVLSGFSVAFTQATTGTSTHTLPTTGGGTLNYTSPQLTFQGTASATWSNPGTNDGTLSGYPIASIHLTGSFTPVVTGVTYAGDAIVASSISGTNALVTITLNSAKLGSQTMSGTLTATFPSTSGKIDFTQPAFAIALIQEPTGVHLNLTGQKSSLTGTLTVGGTGTTQIASIGPANTLGLVELGNATIIKYSDNTFESAASILP